MKKYHEAMNLLKLSEHSVNQLLNKNIMTDLTAQLISETEDALIEFFDKLNNDLSTEDKVMIDAVKHRVKKYCALSSRLPSEIKDNLGRTREDLFKTIIN